MYGSRSANPYGSGGNAYWDEGAFSPMTLKGSLTGMSDSADIVIHDRSEDMMNEVKCVIVNP